MLAWLVIATVLLWALAPGLFTSYSGTSGVAGQQLRPPEAGHCLGTDQLGRDMFAPIVYGARYSLSGAVVAVAVGLVVGTFGGLIAGSPGGLADELTMRLADVMLSIPALLEAAFGSGGNFAAVLWRHVPPNSLTPVIAMAALQFGSASCRPRRSASSATARRRPFRNGAC